ncbi:uncharacterized protein LOC144988180 [Oryzias latipes]
MRRETTERFTIKMKGALDRKNEETGVFCFDDRPCDEDNSGDGHLNDAEWARMYEILESQVLGGIEKSKREKERVKLRDVWVQMDLKRTESWLTFSQQLRKNEDCVMKQVRELEVKVKEGSWMERIGHKRRHKEADEIRRVLHQLTLAATTLAVVKAEQESHESPVRPSSPKAPLPLYPPLPVGTETPPVAFPPPYASQNMYPMLKICGEVACDMAEDLTPEEKQHVALMLRERRSKRGDKGADLPRDLMNPQPETPSGPWVSYAGACAYPDSNSPPVSQVGAEPPVIDPQVQQILQAYENRTVHLENALQRLAGQYQSPAELKKCQRLIFSEQKGNKSEEEEEEEDEDSPCRPRVPVTNQDLTQVSRLQYNLRPTIIGNICFL